MDLSLLSARMRTHFVLRKSRLNKHGQCSIAYYVDVDGGKSTRYSTSIFVEPVNWDVRSQVILGNTYDADRGNRQLAAIRLELQKIFDRGIFQGKKLSAKDVVDSFNGKDVIPFLYSDLVNRANEHHRLKEHSWRTRERYNRCYKYLLEYLKVDRPVASIQRSDVKGFWAWLKKKGYKNDYCNKIVQPCNGLFLFAIEHGYLEKSPFAGIRLQWDNEFDLTCLEDEEIERIRTHQWSEALGKVADSFLFMCYTGLHISDYQVVNDDDRYVLQGVEFMKVRRVKTRVEATFPLEPEALRIIEKYKGINNLPRISGAKSNEHLKSIAKEVGIEKNLTNKIARKTFTDRCINDYGLSYEVVAMMLGHASTKQLKHYGSVKERRILKEWNDKVEKFE